MWYIRQVALALGLMAAVVVGVILSWLAFWTSLIPDVVMLGVMSVLAGVWFAAAWLVTAPRPIEDHTRPDPILDHARLREVCRWSQGAGPAAFVLVWVEVLTGLHVFGVLAGIATVGVLFGLVPLGIYLSALADWSGDTGVGGRLRGAVWSIAVCGSLLLALTGLGLLGVSFGFFIPLLVPIVSIIVMLGIGAFGWSVIQLSIGAVWAIQNSYQAEERRKRMEEKRRRQEEQNAARADLAAAAMTEADRRFETQMNEAIPEAIPLSDGSDPPVQPTPARDTNHESTIPPPTDTSPYELAPEEET